MPNEQTKKVFATSDEYNYVLKFKVSVACKSGHEPETLMPRARVECQLGKYMRRCPVVKYIHGSNF